MKSCHQADRHDALSHGTCYYKQKHVESQDAAADLILQAADCISSLGEAYFTRAESRVSLSAD